MSAELATTQQEPSVKPLAVRQEKTPIVADDRGLQLKSLDEMWRFALAVVNSGQFKDINTPENALVRMQAGMELGLSPIWSLSNIMVTNGRPSVWGDGLLGIVLSQPTCEDVIETARGAFPNDDYTAVCEVRRKGRVPVVREFSVTDAKKANIFGKNVHAAYPKRMLAMRARSWACRDAFADALRGLGVREELDGVTEPKKIEARVVSREMVLEDAPKAPSAPAEESPPAKDGELVHPETGEPMNPDGTFKF